MSRAWGRGSPPKRGLDNFPAVSNYAPLGSPGSAEYGPMRTVADGRPTRELADSGGFADLPVLRGPAGRPELQRPVVIGSIWLHRCGSQTLHASGLDTALACQRAASRAPEIERPHTGLATGFSIAY
jgi:hypothetical protein